MRTVVFRFRPEVPTDRQEAVLGRIRAWDTIGKVSHLNPGARLPEIFRICYASVEDAADIGTVLDRLSHVPEIESASVPAERQLI